MCQGIHSGPDPQTRQTDRNVSFSITPRSLAVLLVVFISSGRTGCYKIFTFSNFVIKTKCMRVKLASAASHFVKLLQKRAAF